MSLSAFSLPALKLPFLDVTTDTLDLFLLVLGLRMAYLAHRSEKFMRSIDGQQFVLQIGAQGGAVRQFSVAGNQVTSAQGTALKPSFFIMFNDNQTAIKTLLQANIHTIIEGARKDVLSMDGDIQVLAWLNIVLQMIMPATPFKKIASLSSRF